jgi:signal transduction histidine kinase
VDKIFYRLGTHEGIKMKEAFNRVIPELKDIIQIQSCALFSVVDDGNAVLLEAGFPERGGYHGIGKRFSIKDERYFDFIINQMDMEGEFPYEKVDRSYLLIKDPQKSQFMPDNLRKFARDHDINSILYIPLRVDGEVKYIISFDALEKRSTFTEEEIEIFKFLGRELMKAHRMEMLDDILHDFKNPAIATAGFARRLKNLLDKGDYNEKREEINRNLEILLKETFRLQELALSIYDVGKESPIDLTEKLIQRFEINEEAIKEQLRQNIRLVKKELESNLIILGHPLRLERILDNLFNNATNAIPERGGELSIRTFRDPPWACAEISNTGVISNEERERLLTGDVRGRGINITNRFIRMMRGKIDIITSNDRTTILIKFPLCNEIHIEKA